MKAGWINTTLGQQITLQRGFDITKQAAITGRVPVISSGGVNGYHNTAKAEGPGVLLGRKGSVGSVHYVESEYWPHDTTLWVKDFHGNWPRFVYHFFRQFPIWRFEASTANPTLNRNNLHPVTVLWPPLPEQRRIAEILDKADALRAKRRSALAELDTLTQSIFLDMFGPLPYPPVTVGKAPDVAPVGRWELLLDVARLATGHTPDRTRREYWDGGVPWITLTDIRRLDGRVALEATESISELGLANSAAVKLPPGTVCFSRTASVGFVTIMGQEMATSQDFVNWVCGPRLDSTYLMHALLGSRSRLREVSTGSTHKTIYFPTVEQFRVLVPPIELQRQFAVRSRAIDQMKSGMGRSLESLDSLFSSLQHRAFRGEL